MILLTTKELADKCGVPFYTVQYLAKLGKLPIERKGSRGQSALYREEAIEVIIKHKEKKWLLEQ